VQDAPIAQLSQRDLMKLASFSINVQLYSLHQVESFIVFMYISFISFVSFFYPIVLAYVVYRYISLCISFYQRCKRPYGPGVDK